MKKIDLPLDQDQNLTPRYWKNNDQITHYFTSFLADIYPDLALLEPYKKIEAKPNKITLIPHGYFRIHSRNEKIRGAWIQGEIVDEFSKGSLNKDRF